MPISKSAKKSLKVSRTKRLQNQSKKIALDKALKKVSAENVSGVISLIDKAAKTNVFHANKAARMKSKLTKKFGTPKAVEAPKVAKAEKPAATVKKTTPKKAVTKK